MKAMIFAAGKGERMLPLTNTTPKPLLRVNEKMLIEYHLEKLVAAGIREVVINVAWLAEKIMDALGDGARYGLNIHYSIEPEPLETAGAICHAKHLLGSEPLLLINADVYSDFDMCQLTALPLNMNTWGHLVLVQNPQHNPQGDYHLNAAGVLEEKSNQKGKLTFAGISLLSPGMIYRFPAARRAFPLREVFAWAIAQGKLRGLEHAGSWSDVGTPERLQALQD